MPCKSVAAVGLRVLLDCSTWPGRQLLFVELPPVGVRVLLVALVVDPPPLVAPRRWATKADMALRSAVDRARCVDARRQFS